MEAEGGPVPPDKFDHPNRFPSPPGLGPTRRSRPWYPTTTTPSAAKTPPGPSPRAVLAEAGPDGLTEMVVELTLKLAEALERIAAEQGRAAADLAEVWFVE